MLAAETSPSSPSSCCDVLVAGGGPAGATIAALLAQQGKSVILLDKDRHPRFHIGESLLPHNLPLLDELGIRAEVEQIGMPKYGVEFVSSYHGKSVKMDFGEAWDKKWPYSFQVRRSAFDHILLKNATAKGAAVTEGCRVTDVEFLPAGGAMATAKSDDGTERMIHAKFVVDATGRDTLLAGKFDLKQRNRKHASAAVYGHFTGAHRLPGRDEGNISVFWFDHGWFWLIPLSDGTTSIGAVCKPAYFKTRSGDMTQFFRDTIALCPALAERLRDATITGPATGTGNYSYRADRMIGKDYLMLGDAFAFIDPVFSTGVFLAMRSGFLGAKAVLQSLDQPKKQAQALKAFDREVRRGIDTFSWYIYRITRPAIRNLFMNPRNMFRVQEALLGLLAGDIGTGSPIRGRLRIFKVIYYISNLVILKDRLKQWLQPKTGQQVEQAA